MEGAKREREVEVERVGWLVNVGRALVWWSWYAGRSCVLLEASSAGGRERRRGGGGMVQGKEPKLFGGIGAK